MSRPLRSVGLLLVVLLFVVLSAGLARILAAGGTERTAVGDLVRAEARGDVAGATGRVRGCSASPGCRRVLATTVGRVARPGRVEILRLDPGTSFSLSSSSGSARIAWKVARALPVVQCVRVRRAGNPVTGLRVELLGLSAPLGREASCPARF